MNKEDNRIVKIKVYVGETRPAYDSAPTHVANLKQKEVGTLNCIIARYLRKCEARRPLLAFRPPNLKGTE